jgi:Mce-associated membrane protein
MTEPDDREDESETESQDAPAVELDTESDTDAAPADDADSTRRQIDWPRIAAYGILPGLTLLLALAGGFSKWEQSSALSRQNARAESLAAAKESTIALLSYQPDSVEQTMTAARSRLAPPYKDAYTKLTTDVVIPSARQDHVAVTATVPAAASVSANPQHAVAILFVNQSVVMGNKPSTDTESSIRVTLQKVDGRWLISGFDPI